MGIKVLPTLGSYWSTNPALGCSWISKVMSKNRFFKINQYLHVANNDRANTRGENGYDPLFKIRSVVNHLKNRFSLSYLPSKHLSIDEAMIPFKGRHSFKQYLPSKPTKWGFKVWELCDSKNGFCQDFDIYTGKRNESPSTNGVGFDIVDNLSKNYQNKGHHMYFDRFFAGIPIVEHLFGKGTYATGTVQLNRKGLPKEAKSSKLAKGQSKFYQKPGTNVVLTTWRDKRQVNILSTYHIDNVDDQGKPHSVIDYNTHMGGVDLNDQLCSYYRIGRASHKWWRYIFWFLLNISITNAWILYKCSTHQPPIPTNYDHLKFRLELASLLRAGYSSRKIVSGRRAHCISRLPVASLNGHELVKIDGRSKICRECSLMSRKTSRGYKIETTYKCKNCDVALCKGRCFVSFHSAHAVPEE